MPYIAIRRIHFFHYCRIGLLAGLASVVSLSLVGCNRDSEKVRALQAENERLSKALAAIQAGSVGAGRENLASDGKADLNLSITQLWKQRFEDDNPFRARQRLDQKRIRVTGDVSNISERTVTLSGTGTRLGSVNLHAQLDDAFLKQFMNALASLQKGMSVTIQGRFVFDKMTLEDAIFVDPISGKPLTSSDFAELSKSERPKDTSSAGPSDAGN